MFRILLTCNLVLICLRLTAQSSGPHGEHLKLFGKLDTTANSDLPSSEPRQISSKCLPTMEVYGWHPAWSASTYRNYDFPLLNTLSWFAYEVDPSTGSYLSTHGWEQTDATQLAHDGGSQVDLTVFLDGEKALMKLLTKKKSMETLRDSVVALLDRKDADGVCLDFEGMSPASGKGLLELVRILADTLHKHVPVRKLTLTLPFHDASHNYPIKSLIPFVDRFVLKAYGTVEESSLPQKSIEEAVESLLSAGIPPSKLLLGMPYYGVAASKDGNPIHGKPVFARAFDLVGKEWKAEKEGIFPVWRDEAGKVMMRGESEESLMMRITMAKRKGMAGIAIWALGYDHGKSDFWEMIKEQTADCSAEETALSEAEKDYDYIQGSGVSSAERNEYHWIWMLAGGAVALIIMLVVRRLLK